MSGKLVSERKASSVTELGRTREGVEDQHVSRKPVSEWKTSVSGRPVSEWKTGK